MKKYSPTAIIHEHYHFADIGVKTVLDYMITGIDQYSDNYSQYLWYSPHKYQDRKEPFVHYDGTIAVALEDDHLGYLSERFNSVDSFLKAVKERIEEKLIRLTSLFSHHDRIVHIIQNPTLLKNPVETHANCLIANELKQKHYIQLWHIHDFLEDSRTRETLRQHIQTVAGRKTSVYFGKNGSGIAWNTASNIFYITINRKDQWALENFILNKKKNRAFYLPNPVDFEGALFSPLEKDAYDTFNNDLTTYCRKNKEKGFSFDKNAPILLAAEMARERKNTSEQLLILNMLNAQLEIYDPPFQLLITLLPSQKEDLVRIDKITEYLAKKALNVVMGFGREMISLTTTRSSDRITITDLWNHPNLHAEITTSVKEGFGLNLIHPTIATRHQMMPLTTIGRRLKDIFFDFTAAGIEMPKEGFYDDILIDPTIIEKRYLNDSEKMEVTIAPFLFKYEKIDIPKKILMGKDFSTYSIDEQLILLDLIDYKALGKRMAGFVQFCLNKNKMGAIAKKNADIALNTFSLKTTISRLTHIIWSAFEKKEERLKNGEIPEMIRDNTSLRHFFNTLEYDPNSFYDKFHEVPWNH